ncbi:hypothetical protein [Xanthobacter sediminis]|uniref:hypothetical protein n=1 Tax=Xanthobacter sediminis TaxID=3119926 RepID=UPI00372CC679
MATAKGSRHEAASAQAWQGLVTSFARLRASHRMAGEESVPPVGPVSSKHTQWPENEEVNTGEGWAAFVQGP